MTTVKVNASKAFRKLTKESKRIQMAGNATVSELVNLGVTHAQQYVPKDSYTTYRSIKGKKNQEQATKEMNELLDIEEEYDLDKKIRVPEEVQLSAAEIMLLEDVLELPNK